MERDQRGRNVRPSVFIERDHMRDRGALEKRAGRAVEVDPGHGPMLSIGRVGLRLTGSPVSSPSSRCIDPAYERVRRCRRGAAYNGGEDLDI